MRIKNSEKMLFLHELKWAFHENIYQVIRPFNVDIGVKSSKPIANGFDTCSLEIKWSNVHFHSMYW